MSDILPDTVPEFIQYDKKWTDRRMLLMNHIEFAGGIKVPASQEEHIRRKAEVREWVHFAAGLDTLPPFSEKSPVVRKREVYENVQICDVDIETFPGLRLTGTLYLPAAVSAPVPGLLSPHGHWSRGRVHHEELGSVVMRGLELARLGFAVFSYDMVGFNENNDLPHYWSAQFKRRADLYGISTFSLQTANSLRAVDFLASLPEVDPERIGCTGASGGGSQTWFVSLLDERIKAVAPVCMLSSHFQGGCGCEEGSLLRLTGVGSFDIVAALAPRPLLLPSVTQDWTNHNPEYEIPKLKEIYRLYGAEEKVHNFHCDEAHNYNRNTREYVYAFFVREFSGRDCGERIAEEDIAPLPAEKLWFNGEKPPAATPEKTENTFKTLVEVYTASQGNVQTLKNMLQLDTGFANVVERVTCPGWNIPGAKALSRVISRRDAGDFIFAVKVVPDQCADKKTAYLFCAADNFREFFGDGKYAELTAAACAAGKTSLVCELYGASMSAKQLAYAPRDCDDPEDRVFNPSLFSMRVQDVVTAAKLLAEQGYQQVIAVAPAAAALPVMAAAAAAGISAVIDVSAADDVQWNEKLNYQSHILRFGGVEALKALCADNSVFCSGFDDLVGKVN